MRQYFALTFSFFIVFNTLATFAQNPVSTETVIQVKQPTNTNNTTNQKARLWNLQDADILSVINEVSLETGKNFVVDPRVSGKISLISSKPILPDQVYDIFLSVLGLLGYSAIPEGNIVKVIPNMESGEYATRVATKNAPGKGDEVVVRVISLENVSANQIIPVVRPLLPQWSNVATYTPGNILILLGRAGNLNRIIDVIRNVDKASNSSIDVIPLKRASALQVSTILTNLQNTGRSTGDVPQVSIAADERTNSILLGGNQAARLRMKTLILQLDTPLSSAQGNTEVIYLKYLQAKTFAPILGKIAKNIQGKELSADTEINTSNTSATEKSKSEPPVNNTSIQAEPSTNAIIMTAPPSLMTALRTIISKLDIRPAQVLVEAVIVEIDIDDLKSLGILWGSQSPNSRSLTSITGAASQALTSTSGASPVVSFPPLGAGSIGIIPGTSIRAVLTALQTTNGANILSTPSVVVLDNHKAILSVGQNIAEQSGSYATTGSSNTVAPFNTIDRKDVVLKLAVIPQINLSHSVRMTLALSNDTLQNPLNPGLTPTINTSSIKNSVLVNSDDILVLGGLMSNTMAETVNKIPILGDIPIIGNAFRQTVRQNRKRSLIVFIKPVILRSEEELNTISNTKYNLARQMQIDQPNTVNKQTNSKLDFIIPPWKNDIILPRPFES